MKHSVTKRSKHELKRIVEAAVSEACRLPRRGLWLCVDEIKTSGNPIDRMRVWATLHFLPEGSPFCCGESGCHLGIFSMERLQEIGENVSHVMRNLSKLILATALASFITTA